jgi:excisionase family DNA binding protein
MENDLLAMEDAARVLGISKPTLYRLVSQGTVRGLKAGKQWRFRRDDLNAYLEQTPTPVPPAPPAVLRPEIDFFQEDLRKHGQEPGDFASEGSADMLFDLVIDNATVVGASDIHLEPSANGARLRYRIDGLLHVVREMPAAVRDSLIVTIKERAQMNPRERRQPQDGRFRYHLGAKEFELLVSCVPTVDGESVVGRILDRSQVLIGLDRLGLTPEDRARIEEMRRQPNGVFAITGPAGSGRSTLVYSLLLAANEPGSKLVTLEDPVELRLDGVTQIPVGGRTGLTFAQGMRAALRQDINILALDGLPDAETARLVHEAVFTGTLALPVLPTSRAADVPAWIIDRGVEPFLATRALVGIVAVRLVRRVCDSCRETVPVSSEDPMVLRHLSQLSEEGGFTVPADATFTHGRGCSNCRGSGYRGRTGLFELMGWTPDLKDAVLSGASPEEIEAIAVAGGMKTLLADGMRKATEGITTMFEVMRVVTVA